jgi:hypothetical protein
MVILSYDVLNACSDPEQYDHSYHDRNKTVEIWQKGEFGTDHERNDDGYGSALREST